MKKAREVIDELLQSLEFYGGDHLVAALDAAGYVILLKEPSEEMIRAGQDCDDPSEAALYRAMISTVGEEK